MNRDPKHFITPKEYQDRTHEHQDLSGPNGNLLFVACDSGKDLAIQVREEYTRLLKTKDVEVEEIPLFVDITRYFEDQTTIPRLPHHTAESNAFVFQNITDYQGGRTPGENFSQLLQMIRTLKVHGAKTINAVIPYLPHARQEKPSFMRREATLSKLDADLLKVAGANNVLTYHPHSLAIQGFYEPEIRFVYLSGLDLFMDMFDECKSQEEVIAFSTDAGGVKYILPYTDAMDTEYGITIKHRAKQKKADTLGLVGEIEGKSKAIVIDDETATCSSFMGTTQILAEKHRFQDIYWAVSHMKLQEEFIPKLKKANEEYNVKEIHITDTIPQTDGLLTLPFIHVHSITERLARTINRMHYGRSVSKLFYTPS